MLPVGPVGQLAVLGFRISGFLRSFSSFSLLFCYQSWLFMNTVPQCIPLPLGYKHGRCCVSRSHSFAKLLVSAQLQKKSIVKFGGSAWPKSARGTVTWASHPHRHILSANIGRPIHAQRERERKREREWECRRTDRQWARNTSQQEPNGSHMYSWPPYRFHLASARTLRSQPAKHSTYTAAAAATRLGITPHDLTGLHHKKHSHKQHSLPAFPRFAWGAP